MKFHHNSTVQDIKIGAVFHNSHSVQEVMQEMSLTIPKKSKKYHSKKLENSNQNNLNKNQISMKQNENKMQTKPQSKKEPQKT